MRTISVLLLALICYSFGGLVRTQRLSPISVNCTGVQPPEDPTCGIAEAGDCSVVLPGEDEVTEPPSPENNARSRFRSCIGLLPENSLFLPVCEFDRLRFTDQMLVRRRGPLNSNAYNYFKIFSRGFESNPPQSYPPFEFASYNILCNDIASDSILSFTLSTQELDSPATCAVDGSQETCVDFVQTDMPTGEICKTCGIKSADSPLRCRPGDPPLPDILHFDGIQKLALLFRANGEDLGRRGFRFLNSCVRRSYFFSDLCITPEDDSNVPRSKRDVENLVNDKFPSLVRDKRGFRVVNIIVTADTIVTYSNFTVRVIRNGTWLYKFPNTKFFQVFNFVAGFQTFSRDATPEGRPFPGYGVLKIGIGTIQYTQTGINPKFLPSPAETEIILRLRRRIVAALETNPDLAGPDEGDPRPWTFDGLPGPSADEIAQADMDAMRFGAACNGILRADACVYQELFFGTADADCIDGDLEGST